MKLEFLGTRGYIEARTRRHRRHSSLLVSYYNQDVMIDCGEDWLEKIADLNPPALILTHAHPDHAGGLREGDERTLGTKIRELAQERNVEVQIAYDGLEVVLR